MKRNPGAKSRSPKQIEEERRLRDKFQRERPSLGELVASGKYEPPVKLGEYLAHLHVAAQLKKLREVRGFSLAELASRSGIDKAAISRIENGLAGNPTLQTLERLAQALGRRLRIELTEDFPSSAR